MSDILNVCACLRLSPKATEQLANRTNEYHDWDVLGEQAEAQGLAPLLYRHLQQIDIAIPQKHKRSLQGLYLRHRHANRVRSLLLVEMWREFQRAGIPCVVVKGAVLAHIVYEDVALRPMRDIDVLVRRVDLERAQEVIAKLGYEKGASPGGHLSDKHLVPYAREIEGFLTGVELHYNLFDSFAPLSMTLEKLHNKPMPFVCEGCSIDTLGPDDMLVHLCEHISYHASVWEPIRLIWIVDVVGFAEKYVEQIDWCYLASQHPVVLNMLSLFHHVSPLSETLQTMSQVKLGPVPQGVGIEFQGWPRHPQKLFPPAALKDVIRATFFPSEWWLRLHYRLDSVQSLFWYKWFFHPFYILGPFYMMEKVKLFWHLKLLRMFEEKNV